MTVTVEKSRRRAMKSLLALGIAPTFAVSAWVSPASAADGDQSRAAARFLGGEVLGVSLDDVADLAGVTVENLGSAEAATEANPVDVAVLEGIQAQVPGGVQLPLSDILQLGAVNQWASAEVGGTSHAAAGAVAEGGGIGTGVEAGFSGDVTLSLTSLLGESLTDLVADLELRLGAVSSEAHLVAPDATDGEFELTSDYEIAGGTLVLTVPAVAELVAAIEDAVGTVDETVNGLVGPEGSITQTIGSLDSLLAVLDTLGAEADITVGLDVDLQSVLDEILAEPLGAGTGIEIDLRAGTITLDVDAVFEGLNDAAPNTELLSDEALAGLAEAIGEVLNGLVGDVVDAIESTLRSSTLDVAVYAEIKGALPALDSVLDVSLSATLGDVVDGTAQFQNNSSGVAITPVAPLITAALDPLLDTVGTTVDTAVFADGGVLATVGETLSGASSQLTAILAPVGDLLRSALSIKVNVQADGAADVAPAVFSVAAVEITVSPAEPVAVVALARSEVGANVLADRSE